MAQGPNWLSGIGVGVLLFLPALVICFFYALAGATLAFRGRPSTPYAPVFAVLTVYVFDMVFGVGIMRFIGAAVAAIFKLLG